MQDAANFEWRLHGFHLTKRLCLLLVVALLSYRNLGLHFVLFSPKTFKCFTHFRLLGAKNQLLISLYSPFDVYVVLWIIPSVLCLGLSPDPLRKIIIAYASRSPCKSRKPVTQGKLSFYENSRHYRRSGQNCVTPDTEWTVFNLT